MNAGIDSRGCSAQQKSNSQVQIYKFYNAVSNYPEEKDTRENLHSPRSHCLIVEKNQLDLHKTRKKPRACMPSGYSQAHRQSIQLVWITVIQSPYRTIVPLLTNHVCRESTMLDWPTPDLISRVLFPLPRSLPLPFPRPRLS